MVLRGGAVRLTHAPGCCSREFIDDTAALIEKIKAPSKFKNSWLSGVEGVPAQAASTSQGSATAVQRGEGGAGGGRKGEVMGVWARLVVCVGVETLL